MTDFSLALAGDAILTRRLSALESPRLDATLKRLRDADATVANLEVLPIEEDAGTPAADSGGTYMRAPPWVLDELEWAGVDLFAAATNHAGDFAHDGMRAAMAELRGRELPFAGFGRTLARARQPAHVDTPAGRVALVAACSTITPGSTAGAQRPDFAGRPGIAPLRLETSYVVPETARERVRELSERLGLEGVKERRADLGFPVPGEDEEGFSLPNVGGESHLSFEVGDGYRIRRRAKEADRRAVLEQVRAANRQADRVVASLHAHEGRDGRMNDRTVPEFVESFARDCVDAGADAFLGHGPHLLRGIEVYDRAPIFYSLGDFAMQNETVGRLPADIYERYDLDPGTAEPAELYDARVYRDAGEDADGDDAEGGTDHGGAPGNRERIGFLADDGFWEGVVPVCRFEDRLAAVELHPLDLGADEPRPGRGWPHAAEGEHAEQILEGLADLSEPYGTGIEIEERDAGIVGVVTLD
jgi:poly-gamma-glutamate synthesis protein (capsule biosynthesis protein)